MSTKAEKVVTNSLSVVVGLSMLIVGICVVLISFPVWGENTAEEAENMMKAANIGGFLVVLAPIIIWFFGIRM